MADPTKTKAIRYPATDPLDVIEGQINGFVSCNENLKNWWKIAYSSVFDSGFVSKTEGTMTVNNNSMRCKIGVFIREQDFSALNYMKDISFGEDMKSLEITNDIFNPIPTGDMIFGMKTNYMPGPFNIDMLAGRCYVCIYIEDSDNAIKNKFLHIFKILSVTPMGKNGNSYDLRFELQSIIGDILGDSTQFGFSYVKKIEDDELQTRDYAILVDTTLKIIAKELFGDDTKWAELLDYNKDIVELASLPDGDTPISSLDIYSIKVPIVKKSDDSDSGMGLDIVGRTIRDVFLNSINEPNTQSQLVGNVNADNDYTISPTIQQTQQDGTGLSIEIAGVTTGSTDVPPSNEKPLAKTRVYNEGGFRTSANIYAWTKSEYPFFSIMSSLSLNNGQFIMDALTKYSENILYASLCNRTDSDTPEDLASLSSLNVTSLTALASKFSNATTDNIENESGGFNVFNIQENKSYDGEMNLAKDLQYTTDISIDDLNVISRPSLITDTSFMTMKQNKTYSSSQYFSSLAQIGSYDIYSSFDKYAGGINMLRLKQFFFLSGIKFATSGVFFRDVGQLIYFKKVDEEDEDIMPGINGEFFLVTRVINKFTNQTFIQEIIATRGATLEDIQGTIQISSADTSEPLITT